MAEFEYEQWRHRWPEVVVERLTDKATELLQRYFAVKASGIPAYSGSKFEAMTALNADPYAIGPADFTAVSTLSVAISGQAAIRLLGPDANEITDLLHRIPADVDIIDINPDDLATGGPASLLWHVLSRGNDGIGRTKTSKLIAAKRPRLIPIWDRFVQQATGLGTADYWRQFQAVLTADDRALWTWLTQIRSDVPNLPAAVSNLRILDVLLWMTVDQRR